MDVTAPPDQSPVEVGRGEFVVGLRREMTFHYKLATMAV